jgi:large subunit ribosomal protein L29
MASGLTAQLRVSTEEELHHKLAEAKAELFNLRFQGATGQLESHGRLRAVRKEIARIYTVMRERELGIITLVEDTGEPEVPEPETPAARAERNAATEDAATEDAATDEAATDEAAEEADE